MNIRRLRHGDDLSGAIQLLQRFFREEGYATPDEVIASNTEQMAKIEACAIVIAEEEDAPAGVATVSMEFGIEFGWSAEMGDLYVAPGWRGRGVARGLVGALETYLKERGAAGYQVTVTPEAEERHKLRRFYQSLGFAGEGREILYRRF